MHNCFFFPATLLLGLRSFCVYIILKLVKFEVRWEVFSDKASTVFNKLLFETNSFLYVCRSFGCLQKWHKNVDICFSTSSWIKPLHLWDMPSTISDCLWCLEMPLPRGWTLWWKTAPLNLEMNLFDFDRTYFFGISSQKIMWYYEKEKKWSFKLINQYKILLIKEWSV